MHINPQCGIVETVTALRKAREDVEAIWLAGSLGMGEGDEFSDVNCLVLTCPGRIGTLPEALKAQMCEASRPQSRYAAGIEPFRRRDVEAAVQQGPARPTLAA
jgi:hypothetical protein